MTPNSKNYLYPFTQSWDKVKLQYLFRRISYGIPEKNIARYLKSSPNTLINTIINKAKKERVLPQPAWANWSLKDYEKISTVDFGNLTADTAILLKTAVNSFEMLTGMQINKSMTRDSINAILDNLDSEELKNDIRSLMQISKDTEIKVIRRFVDKLQRFMPDGNPERIVENFCAQLDNTIKAKLSDGNVRWWGIINKGVLYLETSDEVYSALKCKNNRISPAVGNFKGFHLFVNGNRINAAIKDMRLAQEG